MLDVIRVEKYYEDVANYYDKRHKMYSISLIIAATGGVIIAFASREITTSLLFWVFVVIDLGITIYGLIGLFRNNAEKAAIAQSVGIQVSRLRSEYEELWFDLEGYKRSEQQITQTLRELSQKGDYITTLTGYQEIIKQDKFNTDEVEKDVVDRFTIREYA